MHNIELAPGVTVEPGVRYGGRCRPRRRYCPEIVAHTNGDVTVYETERPEESATLNLGALHELLDGAVADENGDVTIHGAEGSEQSVRTNLDALKAILAGAVVPVAA